MNHRSEGELQAWLDAELPAGEAAEVAGHLMECTDCRARLGELRLASERLRTALAELDGELAAVAPGVALPAGQGAGAAAGRQRMGRSRMRGSRAAMRAAVLLLAAVGAAAAVVPGSPLRSLLDRLTADTPAIPPIEVPVASEAPGVATPGIASVTVSPVNGSVALIVRGFAEGSVVRVRFGNGGDVRARLLSGEAGARFSVGPGSMYVVGSGGPAPAEILIELPRALDSATLDVDGKRELVASRAGIRRPADAGGVPQDEVVLRVGG